MPITQTSDNNDITIVGGTDATVIGNTGDRLHVASVSTPLDAVISTYAASSVFQAGENSTDIFVIRGSATKTIKVKEIYFGMTANSAGNTTVSLIKRSSANSGGTSSVIAPVPLDSSFSAGTAEVRAYTANPTLGTAVGSIRTQIFFISGSNSVASIPVYLQGANIAASPITLRGTSESLAVSLGGENINGNLVRASITWTEE